MATYIQLLTLTAEGRAQTLADPELLQHAQAGIDVPGVEVLGQYGVLGSFDFVSIVQAPNNETIARFSMELGARAGCHVTTLPVIPMGRFTQALGQEPGSADKGVAMPLPQERMQES